MNSVGYEAVGEPQFRNSGGVSAGGSMRNTVRRSVGQDTRQVVAAAELFVSLDPSREIAFAVHDAHGVQRWAEITPSDAELLVTMGARAEIDLGGPQCPAAVR
jgi:hypothetical protein